MNTKKIGAFLSQLRREKNLTQEQLGEILGVTNKTISRWETGNYMPPVDALQSLSEYYKITINEILSGQRLDDTTYKTMAEENIKTALYTSSFSLRERITYYKKKWRKEHIAAMVIAPILAVVLFVTGLLLEDSFYLSILAMIAGFLWSLLQYNRMMAYVEQHAFDGTGNQ